MNPTSRHSLTDPEDPERVVRVLIDRADERARPWILVVHGFKGFAGWGFFPELARRIADAGMIAVRIDFSGNGIGEDGETFTNERAFEIDTFSRQLEDLHRVRDWVQAGGGGAVRPDRRGILGHSRGGGIALVHAAERADYDAVVTWAAIETFDRVDEATKTAWRDRGFLPIENARTGQTHRLGVTLLDDGKENRDRLDILAAAARLRSPTLVVHGTADATVPYAEAGHILEALPEARRSHLRVDDSAHTFGAAHPFVAVEPDLERVLDRTLGHFAEHLGTV